MSQKLTFVNGAKAACGCRHEFSSGGGEYSDVAYVHLCALHAGAPVLDDRWKARMVDGRAIERDEMGLGDHPELPMLDEGMMPRSFFAALGLELAHTSAEDQLDWDVLGAMSEAVNWTDWQPNPPHGDGWKLVSIFDTEDGPVAWWLRELPEAEDGTTTIRILQAEVEKLKARIARAGAAPAAVAGPAWDKTRHDLAIVMMGFAGNPSRSLEVAEIVLDAATEPGAPMAYLRGAPAAPALEAPAAPVCERCGLSPAEHNPTHWCDNQSFAAAAPQAPAGVQAEPVAWMYQRHGGSGGALFKPAGQEADDLRVGRPNIMAPCSNHYGWTALYAAPQAPAAPSDPMDWPLPCDVTVGHGTIRKGCKLRTLVLRMQVLYDLSQKVESESPAQAPHSLTASEAVAELREVCEAARSARAAQAAPAAPAVDADGDSWYLQDTRSYVGNDVLWWAKDGQGYTTDVSNAHVFTREEAFSQAAMRGADRAWPKAYIDAKTRPAVDMQYINHDQAIAAQAAAKGAAS